MSRTNSAIFNAVAGVESRMICKEAGNLSRLTGEETNKPHEPCKQVKTKNVRKASGLPACVNSRDKLSYRCLNTERFGHLERRLSVLHLGSNIRNTQVHFYFRAFQEHQNNYESVTDTELF